MKEKNICRKEKSDFIPINIVYEPRYDESIPVLATLLARFIQHIAVTLVILRIRVSEKKNQ